MAEPRNPFLVQPQDLGDLPPGYELDDQGNVYAPDFDALKLIQEFQPAFDEHFRYNYENNELYRKGHDEMMEMFLRLMRSYPMM